MKYIKNIYWWFKKKIYRHQVEQAFKQLKIADSKKITSIEPADVASVYTKNIRWVISGKKYVPYFYVYDNGVMKIILPYAELDIDTFMKEGKIVINKNLSIFN